MKKKVLFVALYLQTGGVEKSLISILSALDDDKYDVDLCLFDHSGVLFDSIPSHVNVLPPLFEHYSTPLFRSIPALIRKKKFKLIMAKLLAALVAKTSRGVGTGRRWAIYRHVLPKLTKKYDVAISYLDFFCNYYVAEMVEAYKKIVYNHMDYLDGQKSGWPCPKLERKCFSFCDHIISVSESSKKSLVTFFPEIKDKVCIIHNTVSKGIIEKMAEAECPVELNTDTFKIVTVARLVDEKGVRLAVEAAGILAKEGMPFTWYLIGKGSLKEELEKRVNELGIQSKMFILGEKANPYPYMASCDIYVQPSQTEAHCVAVEEVMALARPIVVTNIPSFQHQMDNGNLGLMVQVSALGISQGIKQLYDSPNMRAKLSMKLKQLSGRNEEEINKLIQLIEVDHDSIGYLLSERG